MNIFSNSKILLKLCQANCQIVTTSGSKRIERNEFSAGSKLFSTQLIAHLIVNAIVIRSGSKKVLKGTKLSCIDIVFKSIDGPFDCICFIGQVFETKLGRSFFTVCLVCFFFLFFFFFTQNQVPQTIELG